MWKRIVPKHSKRSVKNIEGREESKTAKESAIQDELVAPSTWAQRLKRVDV